MRRFVTALLCATAMSAASARAADLPIKAPALAPSAIAYNWTGFYVGGDVGGGWGHHDRSVVPPGFQNSYDSSGIIGGGHLGYNYQISTFVLGIETDFNGTTIKGDDGNTGGTLDQTKFNWLGSTRGRVGYAWDRFLVFATGGVAYGELEHYNNAGAGQTFTSTQTGWTVGGGLEYAIDDNWLVRVEYRYYDMGTYQNLAPTNGILPYEVSNTLNTVTAGFSYKF